MLKTMKKTLILTILTLATMSCRSDRHEHVLTYDFAFNRVAQTQLVQGLSRQYTNLMMMEDGIDADGVQVYLGFNEGTHTTRHSTLLVKKDGSVWEQFTRPDYELDWQPVR